MYRESERGTGREAERDRGIDVNALGEAGIEAEDERLSRICPSNRPLLENDHENL